MLFGAIEAGGTKFVCGVGDAAGSRRTARIATTTPDETLAAVAAFFRDGGEAIAGLGIGSFGPLQLDPARPGFGRITTTPKPGWSGADMPAVLGAALGVRVAIDTDVNAAALAEAALGTDATLAYVTVGTGIGVGLVIDGRPVHGLGHPEAGHLRPRRHPAQDGFAGTCPYHGDCLEGLASGPAIAAAWGAGLGDLPDGHPAWDAQADYVAQLCATLILTIAPGRIVLGGGVMGQARLFPAIRARTRALLGGYCAEWATAAAFDDRIAPPRSVEPPGLVGAYLLAESAVQPRPR